MNVKPGDLAIVRPPREGSCSMTGQLVEVLEFVSKKGMAMPDGRTFIASKYEPGDTVWFVRLMGPFNIATDRRTGRDVLVEFSTMWDHRLRPIGKPGEDAVDQSLAWKPIPTETPVSASADRAGVAA